MELAESSSTRAPLIIGGVLIDGEVRFGIEIPWLGSLAATNSLDGVVPGLDEIPDGDRPNANLVHLAFQTMVGIGTGLAMFAVLFFVRRRRGREMFGRWTMRAAVVAGPAAVVALEAGWITTEVGRQPWIVYRVLRVTDAASTSTGLWWLFLAMLVLYTSMTVIGARVLLSMARRWRAGDALDLPTPYGPSESETDSPARGLT